MNAFWAGVGVVMICFTVMLFYFAFVDEDVVVWEKPALNYSKPTYPIRDTLNMVGDSSVRVILIIEKK